METFHPMNIDVNDREIILLSSGKIIISYKIYNVMKKFIDITISLEYVN